MRALSNYNPIAVLVYYLSVLAVTMFSLNPVIITLSLLGAAFCFIAADKNVSRGTYSLMLTVFFGLVIIVPVFARVGETVLFVVNDRPVTYEAIMYGLFSALMVLSTLLRFSEFSHEMTSDKILYIFGFAFPKFALVLSMSLRYIPLYKKQAEECDMTQRALGAYKGENIIESIGAKLRVLSAMVTWTLENGVITVGSMSARGYGIGRRTQYALFHFKKKDILLCIFVCMLLSANVYVLLEGGLSFNYYPGIDRIPSTFLPCAAYILFAVLSFLPLILEAEDRIKWRYLVSKI